MKNRRKKPLKLSRNTNETEKYAIVDEKGNILEKFRVKATANQMFYYYRNKYYPKELKIIEIWTLKTLI